MTKTDAPRTLQDLMAYVLKLLPEATVGEDLDGQLVIYTNKAVDENDRVINFEVAEDSSSG